MTTISQVRQVLQPVLARNPDLELMGRFLFIKPVHHMVKGIFIDRSSEKNEFVPASRVNLMLLNQGRYLTSRGERLCKIYIDTQDLAKLQTAPALAETADRNDDDNPYAIGKALATPDILDAVWHYNKDFMTREKLDKLIRLSSVRWDITEPQSIRLMCEMFEHEVLPALRNMTSFDDFVAFAAIIGRQDEFPYKVSSFERMLIATAEGHFKKARELWDIDERHRTYFTARVPTFYPALLSEDRTTIANIFHEWEAKTIETYKLEKVWERTPFPLELQETMFDRRS